jgi:hypothetical protein
MITDRQYQQLIIGQNKGWTLKKNAMKAGVCEKYGTPVFKKPKKTFRGKKASHMEDPSRSTGEGLGK